MSITTDLYTLQDLINKGLDADELKRSRKIKFSSKDFIRVSCHPKKFKESALTTHENLISIGVKSFIVEHQHYYTVWKEDTKIELNPYNKVSQTKQSPIQVQPSNESLDNNKATESIEQKTINKPLGNDINETSYTIYRGVKIFN